METDTLTVRLSVTRKRLVQFAAEGERQALSRWAGDALTREAIRAVAAQAEIEPSKNCLGARSTAT